MPESKDCASVFKFKVADTAKIKVMVNSSLPHYHRPFLFVFRSECMKFFVAVSILICENEEERSLMINKWIQVADDSKTAIGNLYGFHNVMLGLTLSQVSYITFNLDLLFRYILILSKGMEM